MTAVAGCGNPCQSPHGLDSVHSQLAGPMHGSGRRVSCCKPLHFMVMTLLDSSAISSQGLTDCNLSKSAAVRRLAMQTKFEMIFGRVFQSEPSLAQKLTCFNEAGLTIKSAEGDKTTCTLKHGKRCIDWFRVSASSGADIDAIQIIRTDAFARPYRTGSFFLARDLRVFVLFLFLRFCVDFCTLVFCICVCLLFLQVGLPRFACSLGNSFACFRLFLFHVFIEFFHLFVFCVFFYFYHFFSMFHAFRTPVVGVIFGVSLEWQCVYVHNTDHVATVQVRIQMKNEVRKSS